MTDQRPEQRRGGPPDPRQYQRQEYPPNYRQAAPVPQQRAVQPPVNQGEFRSAMQGDNRYGQDEPARPTYSCWRCGQPGHLYRSCPYPPQEGPQPPPVGQPNPTSMRIPAESQAPRPREPQPRRQEATEVSNTRGTYNDTGTRAASSGKKLSLIHISEPTRPY